MNANFYILIKNFSFSIFICISFFPGCKAQEPFGENNLILQKTIIMPSVNGRIDHMDVNLKNGIVYVAALGNNSLEIVDINQGKVLHSITGLNGPQGVAYIPQQQEIFSANGGNGDCYFYDAKTYIRSATIHLSSDADDVRYDSIRQKIYVGYGDGGISVIDAKKHQEIADIKLSGHPEGFQLDNKLSKLYVNVPDSHQIEVIDLSQSKLVNQWSTAELRANFPIAIDTIHHYLFIGYRHPAKLVVMDARSGKIVDRVDLVSDVDDLYFDEMDGKVYASGGEGFVSIYQWRDLNMKEIAKIATESGARTSLLIPSIRLFILAERAHGNTSAELKIYKIN
jgi:DNA-binding beta-propeller fold protein YncE